VSGRGATIKVVTEPLSDRLRLKAGVDPAASAERLQLLINSGGNVTSIAGGPSAVPRIRDEYLRWTEEAESFFAHLTHDREPITDLYTAHYWRIRALETDPQAISDPRPFQLFYSELGRQLSRLQRLLDDLNERRGRLALTTGRISVLDTNVLLHYLPIHQVPWPEVVESAVVRLVIPLRVIEELDAKKYSKSADLAKRARNVLPTLEQLLGQAGRPGPVAENVTVEVPVDTGPRQRPEDADEEIIAVCRDLSQFSGRDVTLVTGDTALRIRAQAHGLVTVAVDDHYLRVSSGKSAAGSVAE
jgi:rRNA-processing protein FCF1